jgi:hypothetical protein
VHFTPEFVPSPFLYKGAVKTRQSSDSAPGDKPQAGLGPQAELGRGREEHPPKPSNEKAHWNVKELSQFAGMGLADRALSVQDAGDRAAGAQHGDQIALPKVAVPH